MAKRASRNSPSSGPIAERTMAGVGMPSVSVDQKLSICREISRAMRSSPPPTLISLRRVALAVPVSNSVTANAVRRALLCPADGERDAHAFEGVLDAASVLTRACAARAGCRP